MNDSFSYGRAWMLQAIQTIFVLWLDNKQPGRYCAANLVPDHPSALFSSLDGQGRGGYRSMPALPCAKRESGPRRGWPLFYTSSLLLLT